MTNRSENKDPKFKSIVPGPDWNKSIPGEPGAGMSFEKVHYAWTPGPNWNRAVTGEPGKGMGYDPEAFRR